MGLPGKDAIKGKRRKEQKAFKQKCLSASRNQSIKALFQCRKVRRSQRLEQKEKTQHQANVILTGPLGYFDVLPLEIKFSIFSLLDIEDLSVLTITSKYFRNLVELYRNSACSFPHLMPKPIQHQFICPSEHSQHLLHFKRLGLLLKRSTCLYATRDRLCLMQQFLQQYLCNQHKSCADPSSCIALLCYGTFLQTVIAGWDEKECLKVLETIGGNTSMMTNLRSLVMLKPGAYPNLEIHVRLFYRRVFLDVVRNSYDRAWWLHQILKPFPIVHQAKIIFLLYGPLVADTILWHEMCENTHQTEQETMTVFGDLAKAFSLLHHYSNEWTESAVIAVMEEITSCPDDWLCENVASLLFQCGDSIVLKVLASKAINGRISELSMLITSLCMVAIRLESPAGRIVNLVHNVLSVMENSRDKIAMLYGIVDSFKDYAMDLHQYNLDLEEGNSELEAILEAQSRFTKEIILMAFRNDLVH